MNSTTTGTIKVLTLLAILALAYCLVFIPHLNYPYPIHHDEWMHMAYSEAIIQGGNITPIDPFYGQPITDSGTILESGFHVFLAIFKMVTNMAWPTIFTYLPGIIFVVSVLSVYILAQREGFGLEAAFFACLIPTSVGVLGPAFLVPMALGLLFIPLSLFVAFNIKSWHGYLTLFLLSSQLFLIHPPTAIILGIILFPCIVLNLVSNYKRGIAIAIAVAGPFLLSIPWTWKTIVSTMILLLEPQSISPYLTLPPLLQTYGYIPLVISLAGIMSLVLREGKNNISLLSGSLALILMLFAFYRLHIGLPILYQRGLIVFLLLISIIAGAGLFWIRNTRLPDKYMVKIPSFLSKNPQSVLCSLLVLIILSFSIQSRVNTSYYHMIEREDYEAFIWIRDNVGKEYSMALLDPWKATAFIAITQKRVLHRIFLQKEPVDDIIYKFLQEGCPSTSFLKDNGISLIYTDVPCNNPDITQIRKNVYLANLGLSTAFAPLQNTGFEAISAERQPIWWSNWTKNCTPIYLYPEAGREWGSCVGIIMDEHEPREPWPVALWSQNIPITAGMSYRIGGWIKTENIYGPGGVRIDAQWKDSGGTWIGSADCIKRTKGTHGWTYYQGIVETPEETAICTVVLIADGCSGTVWFDDIIFEYAQESPQ